MEELKYKLRAFAKERDLMLESIELIESRFLKIGFTLCKLCPWSIDEGLMSV